MGEITAYHKITIENQKKKRKCGNQKIFKRNLDLVDGYGMKFAAC